MIDYIITMINYKMIDKANNDRDESFCRAFLVYGNLICWPEISFTAFYVINTLFIFYSYFF
jgi:hypothetical protein